MITAGEIARGVRGAWLLAMRHPEGLDYFDVSVRGFWRSFWAPALMTPLALALDGLNGLFSGPNGVVVPLVVQLIAAVIDAVAFPLLMVWIADRLEISRNYMRFIVAYNWSTVIRLLIFMPAALLADAAPAFGPMLAVALVLLLLYEIYIARTALEIGVVNAVGVVVLDLIIDTMVALIARWLVVA